LIGMPVDEQKIQKKQQEEIVDRTAPPGKSSTSVAVGAHAEFFEAEEVSQ